APINVIRPGPAHFLDHASDPLSKTHWYEPTFFWARPLLTQEVRKFWKTLRIQELEIRRELRRLPYRSELEKAFRQYARALDEHDTTTAFLKLWPVLEHLTGVSTQPRIEYKTLIRRAAFLCTEHEYHEQVLRHLRLVRNKTVHSGIGLEERQHMLFQLKRYSGGRPR
ncbi:MAG: hypothetical protein ACR2GR_09700, partial [Rhodothermales bacterium]